MRIDASGNTGVLSSNPGAVTPNGYAGTNGMFEVRAGASGNDAGVLIRRFDNSGDGVYGLDLWTDTNQAYSYIDSRGNLDGANLYIRTKTAGTPVNAIAIKGTGDIDYVGDANYNGSYIVNEQGRQNHVANTMSSPYYRFDGVDDYIQILADGSSTFNTQKFSIEALVYMDGTSDYYQIWSYDFTSHSSPYYAQHLRVNTSSSTLILAFNNGSGNVSLEVANAVEFNKWQHIVATFEKGSQKLYVNGTLIGSATNDVTITYYAQEVWIGKANFAGAEFAGEIQKVRFFNNVLDATEVKELYSGISVPFKYKGASQTNILTGIHDDFDTNSTNHFAFQSNYSQYQATGFTGSGGAISVVNNVMEMTGIASGLGINGSGLLTKGKKFRMTFNVTVITGNWYLEFL